MLSVNTRVWTEEEIAAWLESRPVAGPPPRGAAKARVGSPRKPKAAEARKAGAESPAPLRTQK